MKHIVVLTGAGISAESGIQTFRDAGGLWENVDWRQLASPEGWRANTRLVLEFYNQRRRQLQEVKPNAAHLALARLEEKYRVSIITQNIDDLHERGGSRNIVHLHGELLKARSTIDESLVYDWPGDIRMGDTCESGSQLRPHIVWFGEMVPLISLAARKVAEADTVIIVGTSMQVYPAAGLVGLAPERAVVYYIDPNPSVNLELKARLELNVWKMTATEGVPKLVEQLLLEE